MARLAAPPQVTNPQSTPYFLAVSEGAIRAAQACEPYSLPPEKYEVWKDIVMTFSLTRHDAVVASELLSTSDPSDMFSPRKDTIAVRLGSAHHPIQ